MNNIFSNLKLQKSSLYLSTTDISILTSTFVVTFFNSFARKELAVIFFIAVFASALLTGHYTGVFAKQFFLLPLTLSERKKIAKENYLTRVGISIILYLTINLVARFFIKFSLIEFVIGLVFFGIVVSVEQVSLRINISDTFKKLRVKGLFAWHFVLISLNLCLYPATVDLYHEIMNQTYTKLDITVFLILVIVDIIILIHYFIRYYDRVASILSDYTLSNIVSSEVIYANNNRSQK